MIIISNLLSKYTPSLFDSEKIDFKRVNMLEFAATK